MRIELTGFVFCRTSTSGRIFRSNPLIIWFWLVVRSETAVTSRFMVTPIYSLKQIRLSCSFSNAVPCVCCQCITRLKILCMSIMTSCCPHTRYVWSGWTLTPTQRNRKVRHLTIERRLGLMLCWILSISVYIFFRELRSRGEHDSCHWRVGFRRCGLFGTCVFIGEQKQEEEEIKEGVWLL